MLLSCVLVALLFLVLSFVLFTALYFDLQGGRSTQVVQSRRSGTIPESHTHVKVRLENAEREVVNGRVLVVLARLERLEA